MHLATLIRTYDTGLDALLVLAVVVITAVILRRYWRDLLTTYDPGLLLACILLVIAFFMTPKEVFGSSGADARYVPAILLVGLLAIGNTVQDRTRRIIVFAAGSLAAVRIVAIVLAWHQLDARTAQALRQLDVVPRGASIFPFSSPAARQIP